MATTDAPGIIESGKLYTVTEARDRLRAGPATWAKLRERGLTVCKVGSKSYVLGDDVISVVGNQREGQR